MDITREQFKDTVFMSIFDYWNAKNLLDIEDNIKNIEPNIKTWSYSIVKEKLRTIAEQIRLIKKLYNSSLINDTIYEGFEQIKEKLLKYRKLLYNRNNLLAYYKKNNIFNR